MQISAVIGRYGPHLMIVMIFVTLNDLKRARNFWPSLWILPLFGLCASYDPVWMILIIFVTYNGVLSVLGISHCLLVYYPLTQSRPSSHFYSHHDHICIPTRTEAVAFRVCVCGRGRGIQYWQYSTVQYNFIAKCQYTDCTRNVLWCQVLITPYLTPPPPSPRP